MVLPSLIKIRAMFPEIKSFLMDHDTMLAHRPQWGRSKSVICLD